MRRRLLQAPLWVRGVVSGVLFGLPMGIYIGFQTSVGVGVLLGVCSGVLFGLPMAWITWRAEQEAFTGSAVSDPGSRADVIIGSFTGPPPRNPETRAATIRLLEHQQRRERRMRWWAMPMFGLFAVLGVYFAVTASAWWWLNVALFTFFLAMSWWSQRRTSARLDVLRQGRGDA